MLVDIEITPESAITVASIFAAVVFVLHWMIVVGLGLRIILKRRPTGVSLAWLLVVVSLPFVGAVLYLFVGELWLPRRRIGRYSAFKESISGHIESLDQAWDIKGDDLSPLASMLNAQANTPLRLSAVGGNAIKLFDTCERCIEEIVKDIDQAKSTVSMLFYIWQSGGDVDLVEDALVRAAGRGVVCRVMVDCAGSKKFLRKKSYKKMRAGGVRVVDTLPAGILRALFARIDIRNHRKIITIDHDIAYTGSMNMVDPRLFNTKRGFGQWVDVMARVQGPAARVLDMTSNLDWAVDSHDDPEFKIESLMCKIPVESAGEMPMQVVPSGPDQGARVIHDMLLTLIYNTTKQIVITTPYFIPSEAMLVAMTAASMRGVDVTLVVPEKIDSILVRHASKSYFQDLLEAGVKICAYRGGLLHAKTVTADGEVAMLGTVNMDKRSFSINFEVSLFAYDQAFVERMRTLQESYIQDSVVVKIEQWKNRSLIARVVQNTVQLLAPIL
ncbi:MAG: cardiolipin synthase [Phycisphaerales bacterium]|nr:cardiolipin synthase [Phycisphaerales bacterium]